MCKKAFARSDVLGHWQSVECLGKVSEQGGVSDCYCGSTGDKSCCDVVTTWDREESNKGKSRNGTKRFISNFELLCKVLSKCAFDLNVSSELMLCISSLLVH